MNNFLISAMILADDFGTVPTGGRDWSVQSVFSLITGITCYATRLAIIAIVIYLIWFGVKFLLAQGDPTEYKQAKKAFNVGLVGVIIILGAYTIIATVANIFGGTFSYIDCSGF